MINRRRFLKSVAAVAGALSVGVGGVKASATKAVAKIKSAVGVSRGRGRLPGDRWVALHWSDDQAQHLEDTHGVKMEDVASQLLKDEFSRRRGEHQRCTPPRRSEDTLSLMARLLRVWKKKRPDLWG